MPRTSRVAREMLEVVTEGNVEVIRRVRPPLELTEEQTIEFQRVVSQMPAEWFCPGNLAMLCQYCRHVIIARRIAELIEVCLASTDPSSAKHLEGLLKAQARETKIIAQLMTQLRLTPQAVSPRTVPQMKMHEAESPWSGLKRLTSNS